MRSLRPSRPSVSRGVPGMVVLAAALALTGCSGGAGDGSEGPPRLTPKPQHDVAAAMIDSRSAPEDRLNACELLDLTTAEVIELTGADMPEVEPTGSGDLGLICTYGGPGSPERAAAENDDEDSIPQTPTSTAPADDETTTSATGTTAGATNDAATTTGATATKTARTTADATASANATTPTDSTAWDRDSELVPDTFAGGVVVPGGGAEAALAGQPEMLGARYACSDVRGLQASPAHDAPAATAGASTPIPAALATAYIDCIASPSGGGVEVHTIFVVDDHLWHITLLRPEVPRTPATESEALAGLHRVAEHIVDQA